MRSIVLLFVLAVLSLGYGKWAFAIPDESYSDQVDFSLNTTLAYSSKKMGDQVTLERYPVADLFLSHPAEYDRAIDVASAAFGFKSFEGRTIQSFSESMAFLSEQGRKLSMNGKLVTLREIGYRLSLGYDYSYKNQGSLDALFENARREEGRGGVCGDIHNYIAHAAVAIGFDHAGTHSGKWQPGIENPGGHLVTHFRDPATGNYFVQNYYSLINTHENTLISAVEVSTRILGPLTNISVVEGRRGVFFNYTPVLSQWVFGSIDRLFEAGNTNITIYLTQMDQFVGGVLSKNFEMGSVGVFALQNRVNVGLRLYDLRLGGIHLEGKIKKIIKDAIVDEVGMQSSLKLGKVFLNVPMVMNEWGDEQSGEAAWGYTSALIDAQIAGYARINRTTGKLQLILKNNDLVLGGVARSSPDSHRIRGSLAQDLGESTRVEVERSYVNGYKTSENTSNIIVTEYDKIGLIFDTRGEKSKAYLRMEGALYALEGVDASSATAVKAQLAAVLPTGALGVWSVVMDASKVLSNPQHDPIYDGFLEETAYRVSLVWQKEIKKGIRVGSEVARANQSPFHIFGGGSSPLDLYEDQNKYEIMIWITSKF